MDFKSRASCEGLHHWPLSSHDRSPVNFDFVLLFSHSKSELRWNLADPVLDETDKSNTKKLLKLLFSIAVAFCLLCLPFAGFFFYVCALESMQLEQNYATLFLTHRIVRVLIFFNSFVNPLLYAAQSSNYRKSLKRIFCKRNENICSKEMKEGKRLVNMEEQV